MRITRFSLAGLAVAMVGAAAREAAADDLTISTATTTPVFTSNAANNSPGDITVAAGGSITLSDPGAAITVDSENDVTNTSGGSLRANNEDDVVGILLQGGFGGPNTISNAGLIELIETYLPADADNDGDLDGPMAQGQNRIGILLEAGAPFEGSIFNTGNITIRGNNSAGIRLDGLLIGNLNHNSGQISVHGDNSAGIEIVNGVNGNVRVAGNVLARGLNTSGLIVEGDITGSLRINGTWTVTGYHDINRPISQAARNALDADDKVQGGPAIAVRSSIGGGILIEGIGIEDDPDDDGDGDTADADDNNTAQVRAFGSAPALLISAAPGNDIILGATASGYGLHVRGAIESLGVHDGIEATAVRIDGQGGALVTTAAGVLNDGTIRVGAYEANAYGVYFGAGAQVPRFTNRNLLEAYSNSEDPFTAYAIYIAAGANVAELNNTGLLGAILNGEVGAATVITDLSNTLAVINNSGTISARLAPTDDNPFDDIVPVATGPATAIDLSASTINITINQTPLTPFQEDGSDVEFRAPIFIQGDIFLGSGSDTINLATGTIAGNLFFGDGADEFNITGGAGFVGQISNIGGLTLNVADGLLDLRGGTTNITSATFGANSELRLLISNTPGASTTILAAGDVTFLPGAVVTPRIPTGLPNSGSHTFLIAGGSLIGAQNVIGIVADANAPFVYNLSVAVNGGNANALDAVYTLKTAAELGLTANQTAAYMPIIEALRGDATASAALSSLNTGAQFFDAYADLMPSFSSAAAELSTTAIQQAQGAASNRLSSTRLSGLNEVSVWAQEIAYIVNRMPPTANGQQYDGYGFGLALGIDGPLDNGALFGLSLSFITSQVKEKGRPDGEIASTFGQANAYLGTALGAIDLDFVAGLGAGQMSSRRFVNIGTAYSAIAEGEWWSFEGHAAARASMPLALSQRFTLTPQAGLTYVGLQEQSYTEENGGAINMEADQVFSQRLWGDVGVELAARFNLRGNGVVQPRIYAGYRANLIDEAAERTFRFANGGADFTLRDDPYGDGAPLFGIGIDATNGYSTLSIGYEGEFGDQIERHSLNAAIRFRF